MSERPAGSGAPENVPPTAGEQMQWWFGGPWMSRLSALLLLGAAMLFLLAVADRWPPEQRTLVKETLGGVVGFGIGWLLFPVLVLSRWPVAKAYEKNGCLGYVVFRVWATIMLVLFIAFLLKSGIRGGAVIGVGVGLLIRWLLPLKAYLHVVRVTIPRSVGAALAGLAIAEAAALAVWSIGNQHGGVAWAVIAFAAPPIIGLLFRSYLWAYLALMLAILSAIFIAVWPHPLPVPPAVAIWDGGSPWGTALSIGLASAVLSIVITWIACAVHKLRAGRNA